MSGRIDNIRAALAEFDAAADRARCNGGALWTIPRFVSVDPGDLRAVLDALDGRAPVADDWDDGGV